MFKAAVGDVEIKNLVVDGFVKGFWAAGILGDAYERRGAKNIKLTNCVNLAKIIGTICASGLMHHSENCKIINR